MIETDICFGCKMIFLLVELRWIKIWVMTIEFSKTIDFDGRNALKDLTRRDLIQQVTDDYEKRTHAGEHHVCKSCFNKKLGVIQ